MNADRVSILFGRALWLGAVALFIVGAELFDATAPDPFHVLAMRIGLVMGWSGWAYWLLIGWLYNPLYEDKEEQLGYQIRNFMAPMILAVPTLNVFF